MARWLSATWRRLRQATTSLAPTNAFGAGSLRPRYPNVPATLLGRLAVDGHRRGEGLGEFFLMDALHRSLRQAGQIAAAAMIVEAKGAAAQRFYQGYDFLNFPDRLVRLFLPMIMVPTLF